LEGDRVSQEGFLLFRVRVKIELFAGWIPIIKVEVTRIGVFLLLRERAE
jgi:hypothetical protein